ncbi:hypothetical protein K7432_002045 [Basidiobolus ranarum]|uniref:Uncharacterized protein n=1 Tax=Basidiobolus ranarum TaxID=34480 RepID=A0ABR2X212_9FUNG
MEDSTVSTAITILLNSSRMLAIFTTRYSSNGLDPAGSVWGNSFFSGLQQFAITPVRPEGSAVRTELEKVTTNQTAYNSNDICTPH